MVHSFLAKNSNNKRVVRYLYKKDSATKQELCNALKLSIPTVSQIFKSLTELGLLREDATLESSGGRKPIAYSLVYDAKLSIGVEITQHHIRIVLVDLGQNVLASSYSRVVFENSNDYYKKLGEHVDAFIQKEVADNEKLLGVGISIPGIVQHKDKIIEWSPTLKIHNLPIKLLEKNIHYPVKMDNDANLAGIAETWKRDTIEDTVFLSINKGVGGAIIVKNRLYGGIHGHGGEFGHMTVIKDGKECSCGKFGCLEAYCSTRVLQDEKHATLEDFFADLQNGDKECVQKWEEYLNILALGLANIVTIFDSDVIIGGEITEHLEKYCDTLITKINSMITFPLERNALHFSVFGENASAIGAAVLFIEAFLK